MTNTPLWNLANGPTVIDRTQIPGIPLFFFLIFVNLQNLADHFATLLVRVVDCLANPREILTPVCFVLGQRYGNIKSRQGGLVVNGVGPPRLRLPFWWIRNLRCEDRAPCRKRTLDRAENRLVEHGSF